MQTRPKYETHAPDDGTAAILRTLDGRTIALRGVSIRVALRDLICETDVIQKYQNSENTNIEAVYTFPCSRRPQTDHPCRLRIDQRLSSGGGGQSQIGTTRRN